MKVKNCPYGRSDYERGVVGAFGLFIAILFLIIAVAFAAPAQQDDLMISPDMADYIQRYHFVVDEYGVE